MALCCSRASAARDSSASDSDVPRRPSLSSELSRSLSSADAPLDDANAAQTARHRRAHVARAHSKAEQALDDDLQAVLARRYSSTSDGKARAAASGDELARRFVREYYGPLTADMAVEVRYIDSRAGKGLFAKTDAEEGDVLLHEAPLVAMQHHANRERVPACAYCLRMLGPLHETVAALIGDGVSISPGALPVTPQLLAVELPPALPCRGGSECGARYCSRTCRDEDWRRVHRWLCLGGDGDSEALVRLRDFIAESNESFELAAQVLAIAVARFDANGGDLDDAWLPFALFRKDVWWEVAVPEPGQSAHEHRAELKEQLRQAARALRDALAPGRPELGPLFDESRLARIMGMFEMNDLSLLVPTPLTEYAQALEADDFAAIKSTRGRATARRILAALGDGRDVDPEGAGMFVVQANTNHSCEPNVESCKSPGDTDGWAVLVALRPIAAGEQLFISYIDTSLDFAQRQLALLEYRFRCACPRCVREGADQNDDSADECTTAT